MDVNNQGRPFQCGECAQGFNRNHDWKRHERIHVAVKPFPCPSCDKTFLQIPALFSLIKIPLERSWHPNGTSSLLKTSPLHPPCISLPHRAQQTGESPPKYLISILLEATSKGLRGDGEGCWMQLRSSSPINERSAATGTRGRGSGRIEEGNGRIVGK